MFGPIQGTFLCRLSKELMLTASQGAKVTHRYFLLRVVGSSEYKVLTSRPGRSQGMLYNHRCHSFIH